MKQWHTYAELFRSDENRVTTCLVYIEHSPANRENVFQFLNRNKQYFSILVKIRIAHQEPIDLKQMCDDDPSWDYWN